jgi:Fe-S-cluster containining protein
MNIPAIAKSTFELLSNQPEFRSITDSVMTHLNKIKSNLERARFVHNMVDEYNKEIFSHPLLQEMVPCKSGCTACCHTQVSVTEDEANLLLHNITNGVEIDYNRLSLQTEQGNDTSDFYKLSYQDRKCVFLDEKGACKVYNDRPSVCRTNRLMVRSKVQFV